MLQPVVIDGIRTPIGKLNGAMKDIQPEEIAAFLLPQDVTAKENATATAANKTLVFILSICFKR